MFTATVVAMEVLLVVTPVGGVNSLKGEMRRVGDGASGMMPRRITVDLLQKLGRDFSLIEANRLSHCF